MPNAVEAAQNEFDKAEDHYTHFLKTKFGAEWEAHRGDYTYDMGACIGRTFYRAMYDARAALETAKNAGRS